MTPTRLSPSKTQPLVDLQIPGCTNKLVLKLHNPPNETISSTIRATGQWEPFETRIILENLNAGDVFVDIGANIGYYTIVTANQVGPNGKVIAYEPETNNFCLLQDNIGINQLNNVTSANCGLSDKTYSSPLYLCEENSGDHRIYSDSTKRHCTNVQLVKGDDHILPITRKVNFIKIDTQGAECKILKGLRKVIALNQDHLKMVIEFWPYGLRHCGDSGLDLWRELSKYNFNYYNIDHLHHRLQPIRPAELRWWNKYTNTDISNQGFINLLVMPKK